MNEGTLIQADALSKKYCRNLKRSLWYGVNDILSDLAGRDGTTDKLRRDEFWALNNVAFELRRGECLGLIGRNGAGKTTLLKLLAGLVKPDHGRIEIRGRVGALIALGAGFNPILSGRENIYVNASILGLTKHEIEQKLDSIIDFSGLRDFIDAPVQSYSSGMVVRLGFSIAAATEPDILLLDEVLAVGDVSFQAKCFNTLAEFRKKGTAFVLVSHNMHMISRYCQEVLYVREGQVQHLGNTQGGIAKYVADLHSAAANELADGADWEQTLGSGKFRLAGFRFLNSRNEEVQGVDVGEPVTLALRYHRHDGQLKNVLLDLNIRDRDVIIYQGSNTFGTESCDKLSTEGELKTTFEYIPINTDYLDFSVALLDPATKEVYDWKRHIRLKLNRRSDQHRNLVLPVRWSIESCEPSQTTSR